MHQQRKEKSHMVAVLVTILIIAGAAITSGIAVTGVRPVFLWTDVMIYVLMTVVVATVIYSQRREHLLAPWRRVRRSRPGMAALVVLGTYLLIGLMDSMHFREPVPTESANNNTAYSVEVLSVFDKLVEPLRTRVEKTYSAPFATHLYAREMQELPDGGQQRVYPRLIYGGAHLVDPEAERATDIASTAAKGFVAGMVIASVITSLVIALLSRHHHVSVGTMLKRIRRSETDTPWLVVFLTTGVIIIVTVVLIEISAKYHVLGTDKVGQDVLYQALKSIRTGLVIGTLTTLIMLPFAISFGIMAGYFRGWVDDIIQYIYTTLNSIPGVLLIAAAILALQVYIANHPDVFETAADRADARLLFLCIILGVTSWTGLCRLLRGESLKLRELEYLQAATAFGVSHRSILTRHILPNVMHIVLIIVVLDFSGLVLAEAVLSYVGVGVDPSMISWGNMINSARLEMAREPIVWWSLTAAFIFMFALVLAANIFSDTVRDAFDPRLRTA